MIAEVLRPEYGIAALLFSLELFHVVAHTIVMLGIRLLPRQLLVERKLYFVVDTSSLFMSFLYTKRAWPLAVAQIAQHLFYIFTWDRSEAAKTVIDWSSIEFKGSRMQPILVLGTLFDILCHAFFVFALTEHMSVTTTALAGAISLSLIYHSMFSRQSLWKAPSAVSK
jgi:hypothetical protein